MRIKVDSSSPGRLQVSFLPPVSGRIWGFAFGFPFSLVGLFLLFTSLPHTEFLQCRRSWDGITCTSGQSLAGTWVISQRTIFMDHRCSASMEEILDESETKYRMVITGTQGFLYFGKTKGYRREAERIVYRVNQFLQGRNESHFEWHENVWLWFAAPFGLGAVFIGLLAIGITNCRDLWVFDTLRAEVTRRTFCFFPVRSRCWPIGDIAACSGEHARDSDGDVSYNGVIRFHSGTAVRMSTASWQARDGALLDQTVEMINGFLRSGATSIQ